MVAKKSAKEVSNDIKDVAKELAMLDENPVEEIKASAKESVKETAKKATTSAKKVASTAKETAKETAKKATQTAKKASEAAKETAKKATASAKSTVKKVTTKTEINRVAVVEYAGNQYFVEDIIERCEAKYKAENKKKTYKDIKVYIKPENNAAYYVVDEKSADKINLI